MPPNCKIIRQQRLANKCIAPVSPAKTVADCFKYRNKLGLAVAIEALCRGSPGRELPAVHPLRNHIHHATPRLQNQWSVFVAVFGQRGLPDP